MALITRARAIRARLASMPAHLYAVIAAAYDSRRIDPRLVRAFTRPIAGVAVHCAKPTHEMIVSPRPPIDEWLGGIGMTSRLGRDIYDQAVSLYVEAMTAFDRPGPTPPAYAVRWAA